MSNHIVHEFFNSRHFREGIPALPGRKPLQVTSTGCQCTSDAVSAVLCFEEAHIVRCHERILLMALFAHVALPGLCYVCQSTLRHSSTWSKACLSIMLQKGASRACACCADAYNILQRLKQNHDLVVVTSRQYAIQDATLQWLDMHFPGTFSSVHFGNHFAKAGASRKKSEICCDIGADVLIDDNPTYAHDCAQAGMQVLLFNWRLSYPWSVPPDQCASAVFNFCTHRSSMHACVVMSGHKGAVVSS